MLLKQNLIRVTIQNGSFVIDENKVLPGRGAYICRDMDCIKKAQKSKGLERSMKRNVAPEIYAQIQAVTER